MSVEEETRGLGPGPVPWAHLYALNKERVDPSRGAASGASAAAVSPPRCGEINDSKIQKSNAVGSPTPSFIPFSQRPASPSDRTAPRRSPRSLGIGPRAASTATIPYANNAGCWARGFRSLIDRLLFRL